MSETKKKLLSKKVLFYLQNNIVSVCVYCVIILSRLIHKNIQL